MPSVVIDSNYTQIKKLLMPSHWLISVIHFNFAIIFYNNDRLQCDFIIIFFHILTF